MIFHTRHLVKTIILVVYSSYQRVQFEFAYGLSRKLSLPMYDINIVLICYSLFDYWPIYGIRCGEHARLTHVPDTKLK